MIWNDKTAEVFFEMVFSLRNYLYDGNKIEGFEGSLFELEDFQVLVKLLAFKRCLPADKYSFSDEEYDFFKNLFSVDIELYDHMDFQKFYMVGIRVPELNSTEFRPN
jgi:hypothetical protein